MAKPDKPPKDPPGGGGGGGGKPPKDPKDPPGGGGGGGGKPPKNPPPGVVVPGDNKSSLADTSRRARDSDESKPDKKFKFQGEGALRIGLNVPEPSSNGLNFPGEF